MANTLGAQNPFRYRGYVYDTETGLYYLQSRYYAPEIGRFISADAFTSTGQGLLGNNMFAYCGNNPVNNIDSTGAYYTSGQIHDFVVADICEGDPYKVYKGTYIKYLTPFKKRGKTHTYGFCDIYDTNTHEIWEVKRFGGSTGCSNTEALKQLLNYVNNGKFAYLDGGPYEVGGTHSTIETNWFTKTDNDGEGTYVIAYWDASAYGVNGIIHYDYYYLPSESELVTIGIIGVAGLSLLGIAGLSAGAIGSAVGGLIFA